jgi:hypothetical protein
MKRKATRPAIAIASIVVLVLLATGCGGSSKAGGPGLSQSAVGYSRCMRSDGVPNYPDPDSSGQIPKGDAGRFGVSTSAYKRAAAACQHLLPAGGSFEQGALQCTLAADCPQAVAQQMTSAMRKFARCMRSQGVLNWPDPTLDSQGRPVFAISVSKDGFDPDSQQISGKDQECEGLTGQHADASGHEPGVDGPRAVSR